MATYTITMQDIEDYLDSKQDDEVIGVTCDGMNCLVAKAFKAKYPGCNNILVDGIGFSVWPPLSVRWHHTSTDDAVRSCVQRFDALDEEGRPITKREWEVAR